MTTVDFFSELPIWPRDVIDQEDWFNQLKTKLNNLDAIIDAAVVDVVTLEQSSEPSQSDWETAYTTQTGKSLPIPASTKLQWWDTTNNRFGGEYGTLLNDTTVYPRSSVNSPGSIALAESDFKSDSHSVDYDLGSNVSNHPVVTFTSNVRMKLHLIYQLMTTLSSGSGSWGADFLINGVKAGTLYYSLASNRGITERTTTGQLIAQVVTPTLEPDTYTIQAIFGRTNSTTPTVSLANSARILLVKGIAQA